GDLTRRKAAPLRVLVYQRFVFGEIDAESLIRRNVALDPLNVGAELLQGRVRLLRGLAQGLPLGAADRGQLALDDEFPHEFLPMQYSGYNPRGFGGRSCRPGAISARD